MWLWLPVLTLLVVSLCYVASGHRLLEGEKEVVEGTFMYKFLLFDFRELFAGQSVVLIPISGKATLEIWLQKSKNEAAWPTGPRKYT